MMLNPINSSWSLGYKHGPSIIIDGHHFDMLLLELRHHLAMIEWRTDQVEIPDEREASSVG